MIEKILTYLICPSCKKSFNVTHSYLVCPQNHRFPIVDEIPKLLPHTHTTDFKSTSDLYGKLWVEDFDHFTSHPPSRWHFDHMQEVIPEKIVQGSLGLEIGCGNGYDSITMAKSNPQTQIIGVDISESVFFAQKYKKNLENVSFLRASATHLPFKDNLFDFCYSFGVLHHLPHPYEGFREITRVLKPGGKLYLYLYEDHKGNPLKYYPLKGMALFRKLSTRLSPSQLKAIATLLSPFIVIGFSWPTRILKRFKKTKPIADKIPFNFGRGLFSIKGDLYDRLGAPHEHRLNQSQLTAWHDPSLFEHLRITKLKTSAGWVTAAKKRELHLTVC